MASIYDYSQTPASNTALAPENMAPSAVNDAIRQVQADIAGGVLEVYTTGGAADAYTVTLSPAISSYTTTADLRFTAKIHTANLTTTPTINLNGLGAKTIKDRAGAALVAGAMPTNCLVKFWYNGTDMIAEDIGGGALSGTSLSLSGSLSVGTTSQLTGTVTGPSGTWSSTGMNLDASDAYSINGTSVLNATTLGSGVTASSLTSLGTIASLVATSADINGGTIDGAAIGGASPSTGAFTTLTATRGSVGVVATFTGGTKPGYIYSSNSAAYFAAEASVLNAVGVLDTGSVALYAGGVNSANVTSTGLQGAIGATTPSTGAFTTLGATGTATLARLDQSNGTVTFSSLGNGASTWYLGTTNNYPVDILVNGSVQGQFTTTGINSFPIGATTPSTGAFTTLSATGNVTLGDAAGDTITANGTFGAILSSSSIKSSSASAGVGYATGAGGTVTQITNKGTAVTINKTAGRITTSNASLNNNTTIGFTVNNTSVGADDTVVLSLSNASSHTATAYYVWVDGLRANAFEINIRNESGGALAEAIGINFAVIKGVTS